jgi:hypothetical protein
MAKDMRSIESRDYDVIDDNREVVGTLSWALCEDFADLDDVVGFTRLDKAAKFSGLPASFNTFRHFQQQLPISEIYPVAVLNDLEIFRSKRQRGLGKKTLRAFRALIEECHPSLGLLMIGTQGDEIEEGTLWRVHFYEGDSWTRLESPPIPGLIRVWMYNLLPSLLPDDRVLRDRLVKKAPNNRLPEPIPIRSDGRK